MRITNGIMINNSLYNINNNKQLYDTLNTQLSTKKKIQKPSEDPIVAVRALRLRTTYTEIEQYLDKNIPDADNWLTYTERALDKVETMVGDIIEICNQGINDYYDDSNRSSLLTTLEHYVEQIYETGNADYAGRSIFTGYKTDKTLTFGQDSDLLYSITEEVDLKNVTDEYRIVGSVDDMTVADVQESSVQNVKSKIFRFAYDKLDTSSLTFDVQPPSVYMNVDFIPRSIEEYGDSVYNPEDMDVYFIKETGELVFSESAYDYIQENNGTLKVTYSKDGFDAEDVRPEMYFDCTDQTNDIVYNYENQSIEYTVNFNQTLKVNTTAKEAFSTDMGRDLENLMLMVSNVTSVKQKVDELNQRYGNETDEIKKSQLKTMIDAAELELTYANENMGNCFTQTLSRFQEHENTVTLAITDSGARRTRLELNKSRLTDQKANIQSLISSNEAINPTTVAIELAEAESIYDASLAAAAKIVKSSLLDYI